MLRTPILRVLFLCLCLLIVPALAAAQGDGPPPDIPPGQEPLPPEMFNPDADQRVLPPLLSPGQMPAVEEAGGDAGAPVVGDPAGPLAAEAEGLWSRAIYYGYDGNDYELYALSPESTQMYRDARVLTNSKFIEAQPALSPDGRRVAFVSDRGEGDLDIYVAPFDPNGPLGQPVLLTHLSKDQYWPVWSPDGTRLAFYSYVGDQAEIFVINADGSGLRRLTDNPAFDGYPTWSPDGARLAFSSTRTGGYRIHVMNADGSGVGQVSSQVGSLFPVWSPDGGRILYSADPDLDGWLDLMIVDANGLNQTPLRDLPPQTDGRCRSWSPVGNRAACTLVMYVLHNNVWYISVGEIVSVGVSGVMDDFWLGHGPSRYFDPSWASLDHEPPVAAVAPLPAQSPGPFTVRWSAVDAGLAGLRDVTIQVSVNNGPWTNWQTADPETTQAEYPGVGGTTYAFRSQARDFAGNVEAWPAAPEAVTAVEALPPQTWLGALPAHSRADTRLTLYWGGADPGGSGIRGYQVQMKRGGAWADWFANTLQTQAALDAPAMGIAPGETLRFRVRATDRAGNVEAWRSEAGDAATTLYTWRVSGRVTDHAGVPVGGAAVAADPATLGPVSSSVEGAYAAYLGGAAGTAAIQWAKAGYGALPLTSFGTTADAALDVALPPADNALANGDFEAGGWGAWTAGGTLPAALSAEARLTGAQGARLGGGALFGPAGPVGSEPRQWPVDKQVATVTGQPYLFWRESANPSVLMTSTRLPDGSWSGPTLLGKTGGYLLEQDSQGRLHLILTNVIPAVYRRMETDGTWSAPQTVANESLGFDADMAVGPNGTVHVVWTIHAAIYYSWRNPAGVWSAPQIVASGEPRELAAAMMGDGRLYLVWQDGATRHRLWARYRMPGGGWSAEHKLAEGYGVFLYSLTQAGGQPYVLWKESEAASMMGALYDGVAWRVETVAANDASFVAEAAAPSGEVHLLFERAGQGLYYMKRGASWGTPQLLELDMTYFNPSDLRLSLGAAGRPQLVVDGTQNEGQPTPEIYFIRQQADGAWERPLRISSGDGQVNSAPAQTVDAAGQTHVVWVARAVGSPYQLYSLRYAGPPLAESAGEATLSQTVAIPAGMSHPALSFAYRAAALEVAVQPQSLSAAGAPAEQTPAAALPPSPAAMRRHRIDLSAYAGQTVTVRFRLPQAAGAPVPRAWLDDVALGAARADLWVTGDSTPGLPGETIIHTLQVGNRGAAPAEGATLTYALPPELTFVSADPAPAGTSPLRWELGALPAGGAPLVIRVTVTIKASATPLRTVVSTAAAATPGELELLNNEAAVRTLLARTVSLPAVLKD
jgi:uncharacterized repeat protein (TIGR01451 family)